MMEGLGVQTPGPFRVSFFTTHPCIFRPMSQESRSPITIGRVAIGASVIALAFYLLTMNRTIGFIDKGELLAAASTLGIPHPTGYPTSMLLGYLFTIILPFRDVVALNIMSAILTAASAGALTLLLDNLFGRLAPAPASVKRGGRTKGAKGKGGVKGKSAEGPGPSNEPDGPTRTLLAGGGALGIAFTAIWWGQGNGFEVYSLHALLLPLIVLTFLRFVDAGMQTEAKLMTRQGNLFAFLVGLSFTNHLTTVLLAPGLLLYYVAATPKGKSNWWFKRLIALAPAFLVGLLPYLWLPIRASAHPWFNWGNPATLDALIKHISGKQYQVWFGKWEVFGDQTSFFFGGLPMQVGIIGLLLAIGGLVLLIARNGRLAATLIVFIVTCIIWSGSYDIQEIAPYYMTAILGIGLLSGLGLRWVHERFGRQGALGAAAALVALTLFFNYSSSDESKNFYVEDMTRNTLNELPRNAMIFSSLWDFWVAGSFYLQKVENVRPDVLVIDQELMRRSWYLDQLESNHPEFIGPVRKEMEALRKQLYKFEHDLPYDGAEIDAAYYGLMDAMIDRHIAQRPAFVTLDFPMEAARSYKRTPQGLAFRLQVDSTTYLPAEFPRYTFHPLPGHVDYYSAKTHEIYANMLFARAQYEREHGNDTLALRYVDYALTFDPGYDPSSIPSLPLKGEDRVLEVLGFFDQLRSLRGPNRQ